MPDHRYGTDKFCLGCSAAASEVRQGTKPLECPAIYGTLGKAGTEYILTPAGGLAIKVGGFLVRLDKAEADDLREALAR